MKKVIAFLELIRSINLLLIASGITLFYFLLLVPAHKFKLFTTLLPFTNLEFVLFVLSVVFLGAAGSIISDYYDFEKDKEFNPQRPLPQGFFSLDIAMYLHAAFAFTGIGIGFYLGYKGGNFKVGYIYVIGMLLLYLYAAYLKKISLAGNIVISALMGFVLLLLMLFEVAFLNTISFEGARYVLDMLLWQVKFYGGGAFLLTLSLQFVYDLENREADEAYNVNTFAVQFGENIAKATTAFVLVILLAGLIFFMRGFIEAQAFKEFFYFIFTVVIPVIVVMIMLLLAKEQKQYFRIGLFLKIIMLMSILSIPVFYLLNK